MVNKLKSDYLSIWNQLENGYWVMIRTRPADYAKRVVQEYNEIKMEADRYYACFPVNVNPNA